MDSGGGWFHYKTDRKNKDMNTTKQYMVNSVANWFNNAFHGDDEKSIELEMYNPGHGYFPRASKVYNNNTKVSYENQPAEDLLECG